MIDVAPHDLETIKRILARHIPDCEVRAFGSRVSWTAKSTSDLDLAVIGDKELPRKTLVKLTADLEDSALPFTVDILDWHRISPEFRQHISKQFEIIQSKQDRKAIPEGWRMMKVSEFADVVGGGTPSTKQEEFWNGDIPWLTPKDLSEHQGRQISRGERNISRLGLENSSARLVPAGTVLLTSRAPVGYVAIAKNPVSTNQGFRSLVIKDGFYPEFIYYLLLNSTEYLCSHASGSTFQEISGSTLSGLDFLMPALTEQQAIANVLGTLDDKIDLNRRMNETLEAMAQAIFKSWFVDFDPVRAKASELIRDGVLEIGDGYRAKNEELRDPGLPFIRAANLNNGFDTEGADRLFEKSVAKAGTKISRVGDVAFTSKGTIGRFARVGEKTERFVYSPQVCFWRSLDRSRLHPAILYCWMQTDDFRAQIMAVAGQTDMAPYVSLADQRQIDVPLFPTTQQEMGEKIASLLVRESHNQAASRTLASLRDTLLPKIISGEVRVAGHGQFLEAMP